MSQEIGDNQNKVYKVVLTGGPCGGKTTGQARLCTFFESLGWKVYRAQETALQFLSGGVRFQDLTPDQVFVFQRNIIKTMMQIENTFFDLARTSQQNCLVICDRGVMDASASKLFPVQILGSEPALVHCDITSEDWEKMKKECGWNEIDLRDNRYNQIVHMVSAANGAEPFYTVAGHKTRHEGLTSARKLDDMTAQAWVGHPYYDVVDNSTGFENKLTRMIHKICDRLGIDTGDRLEQNSKKRKFLVKALPPDEKFPQYQDFDVIHDYLITPSRKMQARLRKRGNSGYWTYTHTIRKPEIDQQCVELKMNIGSRDYQLLLEQKDDKHHRIYKKRRCFLWNNSYFQMDVYQEPCPGVCKGLVLMETFTTQDGADLKTPDFIEIIKEVTGNPSYSMFYLSLTETWQGKQNELDGSEDK